MPWPQWLSILALVSRTQKPAPTETASAEGTADLRRGPRVGTLVLDECEIQCPEGAGATWRFAKPVIRIGKAPGNDVVLEDSSVSRSHCIIERTERGYMLRDAGSRNGTRVNGLEVKEVVLLPECNLELGNLRLRFSSRSSRIPVAASRESTFMGLMGRSPCMSELFGFLEKVAPTDLPVLLHGETGTGKERVARALHEGSRRSLSPLVVFDCGATDPAMISSALFGHQVGAFTGAATARKGAFQAASGGTLFLDEIGELPLDLQPRLLRAIELGEVQPLGADHPVRVDVRLVSATHRSLPEMVKSSRFREDLYFRLAGIVLTLPPLRDRREDIVELARRFLAEFGEHLEFDESATSALLAHPWPGNVRELRAAVRRAAALATGERVGVGDLGLATTPGGATPAVGRGEAPSLDLETVERAAILEALEATRGNRTEAARILGITRQGLRKKMIRFGLP